MRIISPFRDYYDSVQRYGVDTKCVWVRKEKEIELENGVATVVPHELYHTASILYDRLIVIGFCGRLYYILSGYDRGLALISDDLKVAAEQYLNEKIRKRIPWTVDYFYQAVGFLKHNQGREASKELFLAYNTPVWKYPDWESTRAHGTGRRRDTLTINTHLNNLQFYRLVDPYTAYQDLSNYVCGVLRAGEPQTADVPDEYLARQKGFDKWSFRRLPSKKRKKGK